MPVLDEILRKKLANLEEAHARRTLQEDRLESPVILRRDKRYVSFGTNNYLGLTHHPKVIAAGKQASENLGSGGGASRLVTGNHPLYTETEALLARMKHAAKALIFGSGYLAHLGVIPALVGKRDVILLDEFSHASMIDAAKLSGAAHFRFLHNDVGDLERLLKTYRSKYENCLILTESVFSMDGDRAPLEALQTLANTHDSWLLTDEAHLIPSPACGGGLGWGKAADQRIMASQNPPPPSSPSASGREESSFIRVGTLSKALGAYGGYVLGSETLIDYLITSARSFIFTTSLPPSVLATAKAALEVIRQEPELCEKPLAHARYFCDLVGLPPAQSAIVPLILGGNEKALHASDSLKENGFLVPAIRPPTVPRGTARLRFSFSAAHEKADIARLAALVKGMGERH